SFSFPSSPRPPPTSTLFPYTTLFRSYDYEAVADRLQEDGLLDAPGVWRYKALLPIAYGAPVPPLLVGDTPLYRADNLAREIGVGELWIKDDGRNQTGSLTDRAKIGRAHV